MEELTLFRRTCRAGEIRTAAHDDRTEKNEVLEAVADALIQKHRVSSFRKITRIWTVELQTR